MFTNDKKSPSSGESCHFGRASYRLSLPEDRSLPKERKQPTTLPENKPPARSVQIELIDPSSGEHFLIRVRSIEPLQLVLARIVGG